MKNIYALILLLPVLLVPAADAQEKVGNLSIKDRLETVAVEFSSTDELLAGGWEPSDPDVWRKTLDNGVRAEIALGGAAYERARTWLDADIDALRATGDLDAEQELRLLELVLRREKLDQVALLTKGLSGRESLCSGKAIFEHNYGWANFAYPFVEARSTFHKFSGSGTATAIAEGEICDSAGVCSKKAVGDQGTGPVVTTYLYSAPTPTWTCEASAHGTVFLSDVVNPTHCKPIATFKTDWSCGDPIP